MLVRSRFSCLIAQEQQNALLLLHQQIYLQGNLNVSMALLLHG